MSSTSVAVFFHKLTLMGGFWMYYMLIGFIIVVIAVIGAGYILKKKTLPKNKRVRREKD